MKGGYYNFYFFLIILENLNVYHFCANLPKMYLKFQHGVYYIIHCFLFIYLNDFLLLIYFYFNIHQNMI